jgi:hypothetical protein
MMSPRQKQGQQLYREKNREKIRAYARKWYLEHKDRNREWGKRKFAKNKEGHRAAVRGDYLNRAFGPGGADYYDRQFAKQKGRCQICGKPAGKGTWGRLHQDHSTACCPYEYATEGSQRKRKMLRSCGKCRRGLLCNWCNTSLAGVENPAWRRKALAYLRRWKGVGVASTLNDKQLKLF